MTDNAGYAYSWLQQHGYSPVQAAGIVGNLVQESGVTPGDGTNGGDGGRSNGIAQWNGARLQGLRDYAAAHGQSTPWNLDTQLGYLDWELKNKETGAYQALQKAGNVQDATAAVIGYERPQGYTPQNPAAGNGWGNRLAAANRVFGGPVSPAPAAPVAPGTLADALPQIQPPPVVAPIPTSVYAGAPDQASLDDALAAQQAQAAQARRTALLKVSGSTLT